MKRKESGRKRFDLRRQPTLVTRRLILMNDIFIGNAVDYRYRFLINTFCRRRVAGENRLLHPFDGCAQGRAQTGVVGAMLDGLAGALTRLCAIGHESLS